MSTDLIQRLLSRTIEKDGCWIWQGAKTPTGYGKLGHQYTHRLVWKAFKNMDPGILFVCHKCDTPSCINPDHLFLGSHQDNMNDMVAKGRQNKTAHSRGEDCHSAKLDSATVATLIELYINGESVKTIAQSLRLNKTSVYKVLKGKTWKHLKLQRACPTGLRADGTSKTAALTALEVQQLKAERLAGATYKQLGTKWCLGAPTVCKICKGQRYKGC